MTERSAAELQDERRLIEAAKRDRNAFKALYDRARPPQSLVFRETSASYPSGHATLVVAFWGVWAMYLMMGPRSSARIAGIVAIVVWILAIGWSRLALGAHYLSDVIGGYLLGLSFVYVATIVARWLERRTAAQSKAD